MRQSITVLFKTKYIESINMFRLVKNMLLNSKVDQYLQYDRICLQIWWNMFLDMVEYVFRYGKIKNMFLNKYI